MSAAPWEIQGFNAQNTDSGQVKMFDPTQFNQADVAPQPQAGASQGGQDGGMPNQQPAGEMHAINGENNPSNDPAWNQAWGYGQEQQNTWFGQPQQPQTGFGEYNGAPAGQTLPQYGQGDLAAHNPPNMEGQPQWGWDQQAQPTWQPNYHYNPQQQWEPPEGHNQHYGGVYSQQESYQSSGQGNMVANTADGWDPGLYAPDPLESSTGSQSNSSALSNSAHDSGMGAFFHPGEEDHPPIIQPALQEKAAPIQNDMAFSEQTGPHIQQAHQMSEIPLDDGAELKQPQPPASNQDQQMFASSSFNSLPHEASPFDELLGENNLQIEDPSLPNKVITNLGVPTVSHSRDSSFGGNVQFILGGSEPASHNASGSQSANQSASASPDLFSPNRPGQPPTIPQPTDSPLQQSTGGYPSQTGAHAHNISTSPSQQADVLPSGSMGGVPMMPESENGTSEIGDQAMANYENVLTPEDAYPGEPEAAIQGGDDQAGQITTPVEALPAMVQQPVSQQYVEQPPSYLAHSFGQQPEGFPTDMKQTLETAAPGLSAEHDACEADPRGASNDHQLDIFAAPLSPTSPTSPFQPVQKLASPQVQENQPHFPDNQEVAPPLGHGSDRERAPSVASSISSHHSELAQLSRSNPLTPQTCGQRASPAGSAGYPLSPPLPGQSGQTPLSRQDSGPMSGQVRSPSTPRQDPPSLGAGHNQSPPSPASPQYPTGQEPHQPQGAGNHPIVNHSVHTLPPVNHPVHNPPIHAELPQAPSQHPPGQFLPPVRGQPQPASHQGNPTFHSPPQPASGSGHVDSGMASQPINSHMNPSPQNILGSGSRNGPPTGGAANNQPTAPNQNQRMPSHVPPNNENPPLPQQASSHNPAQNMSLGTGPSMGLQHTPTSPPHQQALPVSGQASNPSAQPRIHPNPHNLEGQPPPPSENVHVDTPASPRHNQPQPHAESGQYNNPNSSQAGQQISPNNSQSGQHFSPNNSQSGQQFSPNNSQSGHNHNPNTNQPEQHSNHPPVQSPQGSHAFHPPVVASQQPAPQQQQPFPQQPPVDQQPVPSTENRPLQTHSRNLSEDSIGHEIISSRNDGPPYTQDPEQSEVFSRHESSSSGRSQQEVRHRDDQRSNRDDPGRDQRGRDPRDRDPRDRMDRNGRYPGDRDSDPRYDRDDRGYDRRDAYRDHDDRPHRPYSRGYYEEYGRYPDDPCHRPRSRQGYPEDDRRPRSRQGMYDYDRQRSRDSQYGYPERPRSRQGLPWERYERPRSRQGYPDERGQPPLRPSSRGPADRPGSRGPPERPYSRGPHERPHSRGPPERPSSRQGYDERPRSRTGYDPRDPRDPRYPDRRYSKEIYYRDHYGREYTYEDYYRQQASSYYDNPDPYGYGGYDRYSRGYLEEMKYYAIQDPQAPSQPGFPEPGYPGYPQDPVGYDYERGSHHSSHSHSRGNTPGLEFDARADAFAQEYSYGSRPHSRSSNYGMEQSPIYTPGDATRHGYQEHSYDPSYSYTDPYAAPPEPQRMTPEKFTIPHCRATFSACGQLVNILPNNPAEGQPAIISIQELDSVMGTASITEDLRSYPGPLVRSETHKNDVLLFCQKCAKECQEDVNMVDRDSALLVWSFLELLIKQNGTIVGTDIADLLLDGHEPSSAAYAKSGVPINARLELSNTPEPSGDSELATSVVQDRSLVNKPSQSIEEITDRFRHLLLHGRKKDALEWAMKQSLWGHALFLASKMDTKTHASIMTRFANSSMRMNDPLQTLFQLMSGRQPASVTLVVDEKWGDWRPHLAMVLSNPSNRPDLDKKSIIALGDTLASKGCLYASHFCYLMAQVGFGTFSKKSSKLVLIGSNHGLPFESFACNRAVQCTEIYEYAQSLSKPNYCLPMFQVYKFLYAVKLAEAGLPEEALHYAEVIGSMIQLNPGQYSAVLVSMVYELGNRLKYSDPERLQSGEEFTDPQWLSQLARVAQGLQEGSIAAIPGIETPFGRSSTRASSEVGEIMAHAQSESNIYQQNAYYNGQLYGYQQNWDSSQIQQTWDPSQQQAWDPSQQQAWSQQQWQANASQQTWVDPNQQQQAQQPQAQQPQAQQPQAQQPQAQQPQALQQQAQQQQAQEQQTFDGSYLGYAPQQQQTGSAQGQQYSEHGGDITTQGSLAPPQGGLAPPQGYGLSQDQPDSGANVNLGASMNSEYTDKTGTTETEDDTESQVAALPPEARQLRSGSIKAQEEGLGPKLEDYNMSSLSTDLLDISISLKNVTTSPLPSKKKRKRKIRKKSAFQDIDMEPVKEILNEQSDYSELQYSSQSITTRSDSESSTLSGYFSPFGKTTSSLGSVINLSSTTEKCMNMSQSYQDNSPVLTSTPTDVNRYNTAYEYMSTDLVSKNQSIENESSRTEPYLTPVRYMEKTNKELCEPTTCPVADPIIGVAMLETDCRNGSHFDISRGELGASFTNHSADRLNTKFNLRNSSLPAQAFEGNTVSLERVKLCLSPSTMGHKRSFSEGFLQWAYVPIKLQNNQTPQRRRRSSGRRFSTSSHHSGGDQSLLPQTVYFLDQRKLSSSSRSPPGSPRKRTTSNNTMSPPGTPKRADDLFKFGVPPPNALMSNGSSMPLGASASHFNTPGQKKKQAWPGEDENDKQLMASARKTDPKRDAMGKNGDKKGWFGGLFSKFAKSSNEIKLPDDKNPSIVWDDATKKWVNKDGEEEDSKPAAPPPTDSDLMKTPLAAAPPGGHTPGGPPPPSATLGTNRFSRQKTRGARGQYVDVFGGSSKPGVQAPSNLFNVLPKSVSMPANIFMPGAVDAAKSNASENQGEQGSENSEKPTLASQAERYQQQQPPQQAQSQAQQQTQAQGQAQQQTQAQGQAQQQIQGQAQQQIQGQTQQQTQAQGQAQQPYQQQSQQFYHHGQFPQNSQQDSPSVPEDQNISRSSSQSSLLSREVQGYMQPIQEANQAPIQQEPVPSGLQFFNPSQFSQGGTAFSQPTPGGVNRQAGAMRYGQRRAYPK